MTVGDRLSALAREARRDLDSLKHPNRRWLPNAIDPDGAPIDDVVIVGGGQSGIITAAALRREGVDNIAILERATPGNAGPWSTFARMAELRTPKELVGSELGIPSLSVRRWFEATHGPAAWDAIERIPTADWKAYLDWFADTTDAPVEHGVEVTGVRPADDGLVLVETVSAGVPSVRRARAVVLTTGFDGAGAWRVPDFISRSLTADRYDHSNQPIDFTRLVGKRIGVLGHGASAFDNAATALRAGARSADVCFRRDRLPRTNPHRHLETAGLMTHYPLLADRHRWAIARHFRLVDQPPPARSFGEAMQLPGFRLRPATPWSSVEESPTGSIVVDTPAGQLEFDHLILATGVVIDLDARPELSVLSRHIARWEHMLASSKSDDAALSRLPYLNPGYGFEPTNERESWVRQVFAFNGLSAVSHGPHSTSISGHRHALPRLVDGITERLFLDSCGDVVADLRAYDSQDLPVSDDFEHHLILENAAADIAATETEAIKMVDADTIHYEDAS